MAKEMIVSVNGREKMIAILDNGKVTEFYIERGEENSGIAGNIYKGRVQRVLPGMQSAFVSIGLERDAFLYVSDFFDEEEEIERIVMEKSKKGSPEEAKREANEQIDRARVNREKQMESVQELAEPLAAAPEEPEEQEPAAEKRGARDRKGAPARGRGRKEREAIPVEAFAEAEPVEVFAEAEPIDFALEFEDSGFERIIDDSETGEMFKDAFMQEAIVDQVRAVEFDMESTAGAEVGSLLGSAMDQPSGFERIADEDDDTQAEKSAKGRKKATAGKSTAKGRSKKAKNEGDEVQADSGEKPAKAKGAKGSARSRSKKNETPEALEDADASVKESSDTAEMTVRRGGRGRRRGGGRNRRHDEAATGADSSSTGETDEGAPEFGNDREGGPDETAELAAVETVSANESLNVNGSDAEADAADTEPARAPADGRPSRNEGRRDTWDNRERKGDATPRHPRHP